MQGNGRTILVAGATGQQGGAAARHLLENGWRVRALTRDAGKPQAQALARAGMEVVEGDMDDRASLDRVMRGVYGVYSVQNFWLPEVGFEGEVRQGKNMAEAAKAAEVQHFVYSSVGGAERHTGVPHFESKWIIEEHLLALELPATILRPVYFMDNFNSMFREDIEKEGVIRWAMQPDKPLQMIAVDDIGVFVALAFGRPRLLGHAQELAGEELTPSRMAEVLTRVTGRPVRYVQTPLETLRRASEEYALMVAWFNNRGYQADIPYLKSLHPGLLNFEAWLRKSGWDRTSVGKAA